MLITEHGFYLLGCKMINIIVYVDKSSQANEAKHRAILTILIIIQ